MIDRINSMNVLEITAVVCVVILLVVVVILSAHLTRARHDTRYYRAVNKIDGILEEALITEYDRGTAYMTTLNVIIDVIEENLHTEFVADWRIDLVNAALAQDTDKVKGLLS